MHTYMQKDRKFGCSPRHMYVSFWSFLPPYALPCVHICTFCRFLLFIYLQATAKGGRRKALSIAWNGSGTRLVSCGLRHVSFWAFSGRNLSHCRGVFGTKGRRQTMPCCAFIGDTAVVCTVNSLRYGFCFLLWGLVLWVVLTWLCTRAIALLVL